MSAMLPTESKSPSRRALLAGAIGGLGAWAAGAIGRASPVRADGEVIHVGDVITTSTSRTQIINNSTNETALWGVNNQDGAGVRGFSHGYKGVFGESGLGQGVSGWSGANVGVLGSSSANVDIGSGDKAGVLGEGIHSGSGTQAIGVWGRSGNNVGVYGTSQTNNGVTGTSGSEVGVLGGSNTGRGVVGTSGSAQGVYGRGIVGVEGHTDHPDGYAVGGFNTAPGGIGVWGQAQGGQGRAVAGFSAAGHAVHGDSNSGWAGYFGGKVFVNRYVELAETTTPATAGMDRARLFIRATTAGKTQLCVRFQTGAVKVLATET